MGDHSVDEVTVGDMSDHAKEGCVERDKIELTGAWPEPRQSRSMKRVPGATGPWYVVHMRNRHLSE